MIDTYLAELSRGLRGPRRVKADLLAEAHDALVDATEAYVGAGLRQDAAQARAVAEFGLVDDVAPGYQAELGVAQGRHTALVLFFVLVVQAIAWGELWPMIRPAPHAPASAYATLSGLIDALGITALAGSLAAVLLFRLATARGWLVRLTGAFGLLATGSLTVASVLLAMAGPGTGSLLTLSIGLPWTLAFLVIPMAYVTLSSYRCLVI